MKMRKRKRRPDSSAVVVGAANLTGLVADLGGEVVWDLIESQFAAEWHRECAAAAASTFRRTLLWASCALPACGLIFGLIWGSLQLQGRANAHALVQERDCAAGDTVKCLRWVTDENGSADGGFFHPDTDRARYLRRVYQEVTGKELPRP